MPTLLNKEQEIIKFSEGGATITIRRIKGQSKLVPIKTLCNIRSIWNELKHKSKKKSSNAT